MIEALLSVLTPAEILAVGSLTLLSLADLRDRALPGVRIFFLAAVIFSALEDPRKLVLVLLVVGWGMMPRLPVLFTLPAAINPSAWPALLTAAGVRRELIARGDLLAIGGITCLMEWQGSFLALLGVICWRRFWRKKDPGTAPALPGMQLGLLLAVGFQFLF